MSMTPLQMCTVRLPTALVEAVQRTADARGLTFSDVVRSALLAVVELDPGVRQHATLLYEIAKTRSVSVVSRKMKRQIHELNYSSLV
jgi:hypothetical protein